MRTIIADVRARGDAALIELTAQFDKLTLTPGTLRVSLQEIDAAEAQCPAETLKALDVAAKRIEDYHRRQIPKDETFTDEIGATLGWRWTALDSVGLYVPGGTASYPSSVLMNAIPARVAGVARIVMVTPASGGKINPLVLAAAKRAGVSGNLSHRRRASRRRSRLWHANHRAGRQDRRSGQRLCRRRQARSVRQGRHRFHRGSVGNPRRRRWAQQSGLDRRRSSEPGRARCVFAEHSDHRRCSVRRQGRAPPSSARSKLCRARKSRAQAGAIIGAIIVVAKLEDACALVDRIAPEHLEIATDDPDAAAQPRAPCRRDFPGPPHAGSDGRLYRRAQPRSADCAHGAVLLWPVGAGFHEAHDAAVLQPRRHQPDRPRRPSRLPKPKVSMPMPAPSRRGSTAA